MSRSLHGLGVSTGIAAGPVARLAPVPALPSEERPVEDAAAETARAGEALEGVARELERRAESLSGAARDVLGAQAMIARDPVVLEGIHARVGAGRDAAHALADAFAEHRAMLESLGGYMSERAADLDDLRDRALARLLGLPMPGVPDPGEPFVLVAVDLAHADTATLDPQKTIAIVTEQGGPTGHTAILAKQLGIPAVTACQEAATLTDSDHVLVDGDTGEVVAFPTEEMVAAACRRRDETAARRASSTGPGRTADGHSIPLLVNIGRPAEAFESTLAGEGVGLLRTEFMFLGRSTAPSISEQREAYARVFRAFDGRRVVVRTLDVGADKPLSYLPRAEEPNPALGVRGWRLAHEHPELLEEQLRAIAEAARGSNADVWVMAPMVATVAEAEAFADAARAHEIAHVGVMIEVPSAALTAFDVLQAVDFASIGTNDLAQYTLAADRLAGDLAELLDPWQPSLLRLIQMVGAAGAELERPVGVCGEAAGDPLLAPVLVGLGVTSLSMAPVCIPDVRAALAEHTLEQCRRLGAIALEAYSPAAARSQAAERLPATPTAS